MAVLAPSLWNLRDEINKQWPHRDKASDGWVGDPDHQGTNSDHNPNQRGVVNAIDVDKDGVNTSLIIRQAIKHTSTNYVIFNKVIWSSVRNFQARTYNGSNSHTGHIHISIIQIKSAEQNQTPWGVYTEGSSDMWCRLGDKNENVQFLQVRLKHLGFYTKDYLKESGFPKLEADPKIDRVYGVMTSAALLGARKEAGSSAENGDVFEAYGYNQLDMLYIKKYGASVTAAEITRAEIQRMINGAIQSTDLVP